MRSWQQKKILEIMESLEKVHTAIQKDIEAQNFEEALVLLTDCQEIAISVGNMIEEAEGGDCLAVRCLEEYCETLYFVSQEMSNTINGEKAFLLLSDSRKKMKKSIEEDIRIKKEIVFLPYKAAMWDSLESIYLAAKEDPDCDAYCVPIPYYDKNPDGSFGEFHYEGREYPADIETIDWENYSFEERRPDAIYIHNPYDQFNLVTSVHPRFYASKLRNYTNMLVYVPYFVLPEIKPDNRQAIEVMKHFCYVPGTIYAHKVILQSENIRQIYINEYEKVLKEQGLIVDRKALEERFLGIGSPKFDVRGFEKQEDIELPEKWKKLILKPDGSRKKVIFYNTTVTALLQNEEKMIEKMKYVFSVFKGKQEETVLWWRPHPFIEATISSMCPQLWQQYETLLKKYQEEGWGIYDDSPDLHRAIAIADAYYGDASSVVQLFQKQNKLILIQYIEDVLL